MAGDDAPQVFVAAAPIDEPELEALASVAVDEPIALNAPFAVNVVAEQLGEKLSERQKVREAILPRLAALEGFTGPPAEALSEYGRPRTVRRQVFALLENVEASSSTPPSVNVFLNCPYLTPETPYTDQHFAGSFSLFGHAGRHHNGDHGDGDHQRSFLVDITEAVETLGLGDNPNLKVQLVPLVPPGADEESATLQIGRIKIVS